MPAADHPVFIPPENPDIKIWRYMDFTKFVSMLENGGLYFCRADRLGDPFEGSFPHSHFRDSWHAVWPHDRKWMAVNCWHMNNHESAAMWSLYAKTNEAVAICSTYKKLATVLDDSCWVGTVKYIDYDNDQIPQDNALYPFIYKRLSFAHENELRAAIHKVPIKLFDDAELKERNPEGAEPRFVGFVDYSVEPKGTWKQVDLHVLIDEIYVAPSSASWFRELVELVTTRYSLKKPVKQSRLDDKPLY